MKKTLLGFTIVLLLMISEILILNNDIASLKAFSSAGYKEKYRVYEMQKSD